MLVFRSLAIGLSAATFALLLIGPPDRHHCFELRSSPEPQQSTPAPVVPTIVDAAPGITPAQLALSIRLAPGEAITSVDDIAVSGDLGAGIVLASRDLRAGKFIDLGVDGPAGPRRVLVLLH